MNVLVKKRAIIENIKNKKIGIENVLKEYNVVVPGKVRFNSHFSFTDKVLVQFSLLSYRSDFSVWIPTDHVYAKHKSIKGPIPISLWSEAEKFGLFLRISRKKEEYYDKGLIPHDLDVSSAYLGLHFPPETVEIGYDRKRFGCEFCGGIIALTVDHIIPRMWCLSGLLKIDYYWDSRQNKQVLCHDCHNKKTIFEKTFYDKYGAKRGRPNIDGDVEKLLQYCDQQKIKLL